MLASCCAYRIGDRRGNRRHAWLTDAGRLLRRLSDVNFNPRHVAHPDRFVGIEIRLVDLALGERDRIAHRRTETITDTALHLRLDLIGINDNAAIHCADDALDFGLAIIGQCDFGDFRHKRVEGFMYRHTAERALGQRARPLCLLGGKLEHSCMPRVIFKQSQAELDRVFAGLGGEKIERRLDRIGGVRVSDRAPPQDRHVGWGSYRACPTRLRPKCHRHHS